jgi:hypothetical protein
MHKTLEGFFLLIGLAPREAFREAEKLEHVVSPGVVRRVAEPPLPAAPVNICRAMISPMYSAMSVAKITAAKGGAGRGLNLKDPKGRLPKPR